MTTDDLFKRTGAQDFSKFLKVMVSGPPKSGKTTLLGTVPNILVLDTEPHANNLESIAHQDVPYVTITNSEDLRHVAMVLANDSLRQQLAQGKYGMPDIGAVAIDTLDTLQKILKAERLKEQRSTQFLRDDWGWLKAEMEKIVELFTALPMHVFFVVHTKTKEMGKGDDAYTVVLPGLEGAISESVAGMVGYSLLAFRKEELAADGTAFTKYWLRTEGDAAHDFLGTRTAGRLPTIIEPNMKTIYDTVMANRPKQPTPAPAVAATPPAAPPTSPVDEEVAQNAGQSEGVQTPVQTPEAAPEGGSQGQSEVPVAPPTTPPAEKPDDKEPVSPAAMGHVKRVYDALEIGFPQEIVQGLTMGEARSMVKYWRAIQQDHAEGKGMANTSPQGEMLEVMSSHGWIPKDGPDGKAAAPSAPTAKVDGTIEEVLAYVSEGGDGADLDRVQEAYDLESAKGDGARATLIKKLEGFGAKPTQAPVQTPQEPVTSPEANADTPSTGETKAEKEAAREAEAEAVQLVKEELGGEVISEGVNPDAKCEVCAGPLDDLDLAELGQKRFDKTLCVSDYLAELKK